MLCTEVLLQKTSAEKVLIHTRTFSIHFLLSLELANSKLEDIVEIIKSTGLQNKKSKILKDAANWILINGIEESNVNN